MLKAVPSRLPWPSALARPNGTHVESAEQWPIRRAEILRLFETQMYGAFPPCVDTLKARVEMHEVSAEALGGKATRQQVTLHFAANGYELALDVLVYVPNHVVRPVPAFLGLNFHGNHTVCSDAEIRLPRFWVPNGERWGITEHRATEAGRGGEANSWQLEKVLDRGYALATVYCGDIDPDFDDGFANGVHPLFYRDGQVRPDADEWGTLGAWAWGPSRVLDALESDPDIDATRVALLGHSRLGKAALWAGARDTRFALVISNESGCGGAAISRSLPGLGVPEARETVAIINQKFPHWFCENFKSYADREETLPMDQHMLLGLIAPRPLYVASAAEDLWAYPAGEFYALSQTREIYELFGKTLLPLEDSPPLNQPVMGTVGYHIRRGKHDITAYDWEQYLNFADLHFKS